MKQEDMQAWHPWDGLGEETERASDGDDDAWGQTGSKKKQNGSEEERGKQ